LAIAADTVIQEPYRLDTGLESRTISFENPTGERGAAGKAASNLGPGRKGAPAIDFKPGQTVTLCDIKGPGTIRHLWFTTQQEPEIVSMYRWHLPDPIFWNKECRITIQQIGYDNGLYERQDDWSCAAFWYEATPSAPLLSLPVVGDRIKTFGQIHPRKSEPLKNPFIRQRKEVGYWRCENNVV